LYDWARRAAYHQPSTINNQLRNKKMKTWKGVWRVLGHTPGHQALFLKLAKTGNILLSGDLVHFTENWEHRYVPGFNFDREQSLKTMDAADKFIKDNHAQLWIQHDLEQNATINHVPQYYE